MSDGTAIDQLFAALAAGDIAAARACFTPDAVVWHGFDRVALDLDQAARDWQGMFGVFPERFVCDVFRQATPTGFVQQHLFVVRTASGKRMAWPVCIVVQMGGDRIARMDEYIDRAGSFSPEDGDMPATPGMG